MRISANTQSSMPTTDGLNSHPTAAVRSYSELLFSEDIDDHLEGQDGRCFSFVLPDDNASRMLCFGDSGEIVGLEYQKNGIKLVKKNETTFINDSVNIGNDKSKVLPKSNKKRSVGEKKTSGEDGKEKKKSGNGNGAPAKKAPQRNYKRTKSGNNSSQIGHAKVKKPKLGERIIALQQLVSPFGKTDTASVLHEAKGYISFLQDQVQLLCSPYLQHLRSSSSSSPHHQEDEKKGSVEEVDKSRKDLRSKGLCLVPIGMASLHLTDDNGADFWSPANALVNFSC